MTSSHYQTRIKNLSNEISKLETKVNDEQKKINAAEALIIKDEAAINKKNVSASTIRSKQQEIQRKRTEIVGCRKRASDYQTQIIKKKGDLTKANDEYNKALAKEQQSAQRKAESEVAKVSSNVVSPMQSIFQRNDYQIKHNQTFVISPFSKDISKFYREVLRPAIESIEDMICQRADDLYTANVVMEDVWKLICESPVIVADLTGRNANVFYEVGLAHAIGKKVIIISQDIDDIPFDLRALRCIKYNLLSDDQSAFKKKLTQTIETVLNEVLQ